MTDTNCTEAWPAAPASIRLLVLPGHLSDHYASNVVIPSGSSTIVLYGAECLTWDVHGANTLMHRISGRQIELVSVPQELCRYLQALLPMWEELCFT